MHKAVGSLFFALLLASTAFAKSPPVVDEDARKAKVAFQQGLTDYNLNHFDEALTEFEKAYRLKADPAFLFNIAQCHRQLNQPEDAIRSYRAYLRESAADAPGRSEVQRLIGEMEKLVADRAAAQPPTGVQPPTGSAPTLSAQPEGTTTLTATAPPPKKKSKTWVWVTVGVAGAVVVGAVAIGLGVGLSGTGGPPNTSLGNFGATFQ
jgi:hypothetical protein